MQRKKNKKSKKRPPQIIKRDWIHNVESSINCDIWLLIAVTLLVCFGLVMVYSASSYQAEQRFGDAHFFFKKHLGKLFFGAIVLFVLMNFRYKWWLKTSPILLGVSVILLILVVASPMGVEINGSTRWLRLRGFLFEPSDLAKYSLVIFLAAFLPKRRKEEPIFNGVLPYLLIVLVVAGAIIAQPDFDTAAIILGCSFLMFYFAGVEARKVAALALSTVSTGIIILSKSGYGEQRLANFLVLLTGKGELSLQLKQSLAGLSNGFIKGIGLGTSELKYNYLPAPFTDFIYSIVGEEFGLFGTLGVLSLFLFVIWRCVRIAEQAGDTETRLLAIGITSIFSIYVLLNMAVVTGIAPTMGLPLPFISYGGTALITHMAAMGIMLNISKFTRASNKKYLTSEGYQERMTARSMAPGTGRIKVAKVAYKSRITRV